jgi:hypothetical protein
MTEIRQRSFPNYERQIDIRSNRCDDIGSFLIVCGQTRVAHFSCTFFFISRLHSFLSFPLLPSFLNTCLFQDIKQTDMSATERPLFFHVVFKIARQNSSVITSSKREKDFHLPLFLFPTKWEKRKWVRPWNDRIDFAVDYRSNFYLSNYINISNLSFISAFHIEKMY